MISAAIPAAVSAACATVAVSEFAAVHLRRREFAVAPRGRLRRLAVRIVLPAAPGDLDSLIESAGSPGGLSAGEVMACKCGLAACVLGSGLGTTVVIDLRAWPLLVTVATAVAFVLPDFLLTRVAGRRRDLLRSEFPAVADRLLLAVRAGLPLGRAIAGAGGSGGGLLAAELARVDRLVDLGMGRGEAFERMVRCCPAPEVAALIAAIRRADVSGAPLEPTLASLASGARLDNQRRITEGAQAAAPKIQLIVALLLVPAAILCIAAGMIAGLSGG